VIPDLDCPQAPHFLHPYFKRRATQPIEKLAPDLPFEHYLQDLGQNLSVANATSPDGIDLKPADCLRSRALHPQQHLPYLGSHPICSKIKLKPSSPIFRLWKGFWQNQLDFHGASLSSPRFLWPLDTMATNNVQRRHYCNSYQRIKDWELSSIEVG
jgi:hypothetical protein